MEQLVEGWTSPIDFTLEADGAAIDGTGLAVTLQLRDRHGALVDMTGKVDWLSEDDGTVRYNPAEGDLRAERGPYRARFKVTDSDGKHVFFPNADADEWRVRI